MRRRRRMTRRDRERRALRNERRGRVPVTTVPKPREEARYFRYGGLAVRLFRGELGAVRVTGFGFVPALKGRMPRAAVMYAALPKAMRQHVRSEADHRSRRKRMADQGVEILDSKGGWS